MKDVEDGGEAVAEEIAVTTNLSQAEALLKQIASGGLEADEGMVTTIKAAARVAERRVSSHVTLTVDYQDPDSPDLASQFKGVAAVGVRGDEEARSYSIIVFDSKIVCESGSQAKYRLPPTRPAQVQRLLDAFLSSRDDGDLAEGDVLVALDGGRENDWETKTMLKQLPSKKYDMFRHIVTYTYDSVEKRMERASKTPLQLHESIAFIAHTQPEIKVQPRLVTSGNTRGNVVGPLTKPSWADTTETWTLPLAVKKALFGKENMPLPGGSCPVEHEKEGAPKKDELVPVFFHESPSILAAEVLHYLQGRAVVDLTPGSGHWAFHCIRRRVPYLAVTLSEKHRDLLFKKLVSRTLAGMADSSDELLFDSTFAQALKSVAAVKPAAEGELEEKSRRGKPNKRNQNKETDPNTVPEPKPKKSKTQPAGVGGGDDARAALLQKIQDAAKADAEGAADEEADEG